MAATMKRNEDLQWQRLRETGRLGTREVHFLATVDSTNEVALAMGRAGGRAGTVVVAEQQSRGRGRLGRAWLSPPGMGVYLSLVLRPCLDPKDLAKITLAGGLAVCKAVESVTGLAPGIKWPNDLLLDNRKFGGILTETGGLRPGEPPLVVLGIGINVLTPLAAFPPELRDRVISLAVAGGREYLRGDLLVAVVEQVEREVERLERGEFRALLGEWRQRDAVIGRRLAWVTPDGAVVEGIALGPDEQGLLHIRDDAGRVHEVLSGDLDLLKR